MGRKILLLLFVWGMAFEGNAFTLVNKAGQNMHFTATYPNSLRTRCAIGVLSHDEERHNLCGAHQASNHVFVHVRHLSSWFVLHTSCTDSHGDDWLPNHHDTVIEIREESGKIVCALR